MADKKTILLVEDELAHAELISRAFRTKADGIQLNIVHTLSEAQSYLDTAQPDLIIMDFLLPDGTGMEFLVARQAQPALPVVLMTSYGDEQVAVDAMKAGALDYVVKSDVTLMDMPRIAERALREWSHIVERQQVEKALQESERRFRRVIEQSSDGIMLTDEEGSIIEWNRSMEQMTGLLAAEVLGQPTWSVQSRLMEPQGERNSLVQAQLRHDLAKFYETGQGDWLNKVTDAHFYHVDGRPITVEILTFPIQTEKGYMAGSLLRDVTTSRQAEEHLRQQERLAAVGQLAAGIAHDFNNIMAVIILYTQISLQMPGVPSSVQERLQTVVKQAKRASELIEQILDFSRRTVLEKRPINLLPLLKEQVKLLRRTVPENITIELTHDDDNYLINGDPARLQQTVMNLVLNARDAMGTGGRLQLHLRHIFADTNVPQMERGAYVCLSIADSGTGIAEEIKPHLYAPFFTSKKPGEGHGLGLAQVYGIIKQHEGYIDFHTQTDVGTTFFLYFPALQIDQIERKQTSVDDMPEGNGELILLVEDDRWVRAAMVESLQAMQYQVMSVANGRYALAYLEQAAEKPDLIISDVIMPEMGGLALFQALQARQFTIPMILISGHPLNEEIVQLQEAGQLATLTKPPDLNRLAQLVQQMLGAA